MYAGGYFIASIALGLFLFLLLTPATIYFWKKRSNFILQTRSPHLVAFVLTSSLLTTLVWGIEECYFAWSGTDISPYIIGLLSHLILPWTILPLAFRAEAFYIMFDAGLRRKYVMYIRKKSSLWIMLFGTIILAFIPFIIHIFTHRAFYDSDTHTFGSNLFFGEWKYFLPLFLVYILLQSIQLRHLTHEDKKVQDTLAVISELRLILGAMIVFTLTYFTWLICLDQGVKAASLSDDENRTWMRLNYLVMVFQLCILGYVLIRQLLQVFEHTQHTLKIVALYDQQSKWIRSKRQVMNKIHPLTGRGSGLDHSGPPSLNHQVSGPNVTQPPLSRENSPRTSGNWMGRYSPKVSRNSPRSGATSPALEGSPSHHPSNHRTLSGGGGSPLGPGLGHHHSSSGDQSLQAVPPMNERTEPRLKSLHDVLRHPMGRELFSEFAARHLTLESVMFYEAVEAYEQHPAWSGLELRPVYDLGCTIFQSFVATNSEYEINIPSLYRRELKRIFGSSNQASLNKEKKKRSTEQLKKWTGLDAFKKTVAAQEQDGTGTATGAAAAAANQAQPSGRFEAFLSLPSASRRELYRAAQDEVYGLLKVNLFLLFIATPEFSNLKRVFEKELQARREAAAAAAAAQPPCPSPTNAEGGDGASGKPQFLKTPSLGFQGGRNKRDLPAQPSLPTTRESTPSPSLNHSRNLALRLEAAGGSGGSPVRKQREGGLGGSARRLSMDALVNQSAHIQSQMAHESPSAGVGGTLSRVNSSLADRHVSLASSLSSSPTSSPKPAPGRALRFDLNYADFRPAHSATVTPPTIITEHQRPSTAAVSAHPIAIVQIPPPAVVTASPSLTTEMNTPTIHPSPIGEIISPNSPMSVSSNPNQDHPSCNSAGDDQPPHELLISNSDMNFAPISNPDANSTGSLSPISNPLA